ncbi:MAG: hypothetical protein RL490_670 [Pseudomonadota bacterium]
MNAAPRPAHPTEEAGPLIASIALLLASAAPTADANAGPVCTAVWHDTARDRDLPVRIRMPAGTARAPLLLFSPGVGGDAGSGGVLGAAWARRGLIVIHLSHPGSDTAVYAGQLNKADRAARVTAAIQFDQLVARVGDARFVLDEAMRRPREGTCDLGRIDPDRIGAAGHSMGAWTVQALAGQRWPGGTLADRRIRAAILLSTSAPYVGDPAAAFGRIGLPMLSITGTLDGSSASAPADQRTADAAARTQVYRALPGDGRKTLLMLGGGTHMMFSGNSNARDTTAAHIQQVMLAASTAFWGATLLGSTRDAAWLSGTGLRSTLARDDAVERK